MKKKLLIPITIVLSIVILIAFIVYWKVSYHGNMNTDIDNKSNVTVESVIESAQGLNGILRDPFNGKYYNIGGRLGFIVCTDVPRLAYLNAGYSIDKEMAEDYKTHPEHYRKGEIPGPYFARRVRNIYDFLKAKNQVLSLDETPRPGDVVFYGGKARKPCHIAMIVRVIDKHKYYLIESIPQSRLSKELSNAEIEKRSVPIAFGRILNN
jgi:hypothetical protein